jgi:hypothetical protein
MSVFGGKWVYEIKVIGSASVAQVGWANSDIDVNVPVK